jgi:3-isopropylmalate/(R)-2-methylmalate dehydratase large subunit
MVFASQCILQPKPKKMRINVNGTLREYVTAKDIALYLISKISASGGTGHFIEFAGSAIRNLTMEGRMTLSNMSIECGARGGMIAPDEVTFEYIRGREFAPKGEKWSRKINEWEKLKSDNDAIFDLEYNFDAADIEPMITYGTNPGMGIAVSGSIPTGERLKGSDRISFEKSLEYMGFKPGDKIRGKKVDYVFLGSCTNGRIEDFRAFANFVKGKKKASGITVWLVPGSKKVEKQVKEEGLEDILTASGFELRQPGCSACLAMNEDKVPEGKVAVSTSNRNFEGRQGPGARTMLASPIMAAAAAITGVVSDPRDFK